MFDILYNLFLVLFVPWSIGKFFSFFTARTKTKKEEDSDGKISRPSSIPKAITVSWLLIAAFFAYRAVMMKPTDFFSLLNVRYDAPNFLIRNQFRDYAAVQRAMDDQFEVPSADIVLPRSSKRILGPNEDELADHKYSRYDYLFALFDLMKVGENRQLYLTFGELAFSTCDWCQDTWDFFAYGYPSVLIEYSLLTIAMLWATSFKPLKRHTVWMLGVIGTVFWIDVVLVLVPYDTISEVIPEIKFLPLNQYMFIARNALASFIFLSLWLGRNSSWLPLQDRLYAVFERDDVFQRRIDAAQMQMISILESEELLNEFAQHHREKTVNMILRSRTSPETDPKIVHQQDIEKIRRLAAEASIYQTAATVSGQKI